jgi:hypothetical protein
MGVIHRLRENKQHPLIPLVSGCPTNQSWVSDNRCIFLSAPIKKFVCIILNSLMETLPNLSPKNILFNFWALRTSSINVDCSFPQLIEDKCSWVMKAYSGFGAESPI